MYVCMYMIVDDAGLQTVRLGGDKESTSHDVVSLAKGSKGGRSGGSGGTINHTPRKSKAPDEAPHRIRELVMVIGSCIYQFLIS